MTYRYQNPDVPMDRNFTDIEGPDGLVSHAEALRALDMRDVDAQTIRNQHTELVSRKREVERLSGDKDHLVQELGELRRTIADLRRDKDTLKDALASEIESLQQRMAVLRADRDGAYEARAEISRRNHELKAEIERQRQMIEQLCRAVTDDETAGEEAFLNHVAEDTANSDGEPQVDPFRKIEALQYNVDFLSRELHATRIRQEETADQLTDAFADMTRLHRVIDRLLDGSEATNG